ncbi:MAG: hypothetical protein KatS3mg081_0307 [Gemmatimonadales bacterium]|nr:Antitoxin VapB26 [bacterium HR33]GIW50952.1 MAG: hypothetical protein KatS3mg081_0307 [Gemmatimonadales bacterium]
MKRTTIFLDSALSRRAKQAARRQGKSFAQLVREALAAYLAGGSRAAGGAERLPSVAGRFESGHRDTSERVDELLWRDPHG